MNNWMWKAVAFVVAAATVACYAAKEPAAGKAPTSQPKSEHKALGSWNFDKVEAGKLPEHFKAKQNNPTTAMATWKVVEAADAPSKPNVLEIETKNANATYNLLLVGGTSFADLDVSVKVKAKSGKDDQGGGLIWRAKNENNYYVCRMNPLETNFRVYKVVDGKRKQLQSAEVKTETGKWYKLRAVMVGDRIECYLDGKKILDVKDGEFKDAGMVGLWTKADASSYFDDLVVHKPTAREAKPMPHQAQPAAEEIAKPKQ